LEGLRRRLGAAQLITSTVTQSFSSIRSGLASSVLQITTLGEYQEITDDIQLKVVVTANDIQGNMYNEICVQDATGGIFIGISQGGIFGYLPEGTEILIDLKGLCIGNYRRSATIGTPYTNKDG
jgi:hypothetical protein